MGSPADPGTGRQSPEAPGSPPWKRTAFTARLQAAGVAHQALFLGLAGRLKGLLEALKRQTVSSTLPSRPPMSQAAWRGASPIPEAGEVREDCRTEL